MTADFKNPELHLAQADTCDVAALVSAAADLTLVVDGANVIKDLSHNLDRISGAGIPAWRGLPIEDVVRKSSRPTLRKALRLARDGRRAERFDISHVIEGRHDLPIQYSALGIGADGQIMLMGRDLRLVAELQSRLLANRHSLERNARNQKQAEAHYRLLFATAAEAIVIVDAASGKIREANPRAAAIFGAAGSGLAGKKFASLFDKSAQVELQSMLWGVLASGRPAELVVYHDGADALGLSAELFRAGDLKLIMVRMSAAGAGGDGVVAADGGIENLVRAAAEAIVLTDEEGGIVWANESFMVLAGIPLAAHALGRPLGDFLDWGGVEQDLLLQNVRRHGRVPTFSGVILGANGQTAEIDLSAVAMPDGSPPGYGFVMRAVSAESAWQGRANSDLMRTAEKLVEMVGRVPMKDLVRDTTDVIERMCIHAALKLTGNNRASAARVLGLSRQALYLKMHRFGISDNE